MGIKLKHRAELEDLQAGQPGTMTAATITVFVIPFACVLKGILARLGTAGTTGTSNTDIRKNGTSIFASGATAIQFASTVATPTYGAIAAANPPSFVKGDVVTVVNTVVHTTPAVNLAIALVFQKQAGSGVVAALITDSLGPEAGFGA
jgi:hypothetical protein